MASVEKMKQSSYAPDRGWAPNALIQAVATLVLAVVWLAGDVSASDTPTAIDLSGKPINPLSKMTNKAVVLIFVSSECPISNRYAPEIRRLHKEFSSEGIKFWLIYPNADDSSAAIRQHTNDYKFACLVLRDPGHVLVKRA